MKKLIKTSLYSLSLFFMGIAPLQAMDFSLSGVWTDYNAIVEEEIAREIKEKEEEIRKTEAIKQATVELFCATEINYVNGIEKAIKDGADLNGENSDGDTALHIAARYGNEISFKILLEAGASITARNNNGHEPIHTAAISPNLVNLEVLIKAGAKINVKDRKGNTPLHGATYYHNRETIKILIGAGANINAQNNDGNTPLHTAVYLNDRTTLEILIKAGADLSITNYCGETPCQASSWPETKAWLTNVMKFNNAMNKIEYFKSLKSPDYELYQHLAMHANKEKVAEEIKAIQQATIQLFDAIKNKDVSAMTQAIKAGANLDAQWDTNDIPLHIASKYGNIAGMKVLIEAGANVNVKDNLDWTPLHKAAVHNQPEAIKVLIEAGANLNTKNNHGSTPLHEAADRPGLSKAIEALIEVGANINIEDNHGDTPLHKAALFEIIETIKLLIAANAKLNAQNKVGNTPLHKAARNNKQKAIALLIKADADLNIPNDQGQTPVQSANSTETAAYLTNIMVFKNATTNKLDYLKTVQNPDYDLYLYLALDADDAKATDYILEKLQQSALYALEPIARYKNLPTKLVPYFLYRLKVEEEDLQFLMGKEATTEKAKNLQKLYNKAKTLQNKQFCKALRSCQMVMKGIGVDDMGQQVMGFYTH